MSDEIPHPDPVQRLLDEADLSDDTRLAALLHDYRRSASAQAPAPAPEIAAIMLRPRRSRAPQFRRPGARTTALVILIAALGGGASAAAAASPALRTIVHDAFSALSPHHGPGGTTSGPVAPTREPARGAAAAGEASPERTERAPQPSEGTAPGVGRATTGEPEPGGVRSPDPEAPESPATPATGRGSGAAEDPRPTERPAPGHDRSGDPATEQPTPPGRPGTKDTPSDTPTSPDDVEPSESAR